MSSDNRVNAFMFICCASLFTAAAGHGLMIYPASRNFVKYMEGTDWCPHCLNAGGTSAVSEGGRLKWPAGSYGHCGDRTGETKWDVKGPVQATYTQGQVINVDFTITENHLGRISVELCDVDAKPGDNKCVPLQRADGKGTQWYLPFVSPWSGGNSGKEAKPAYNDGSFGWYLLPELKPEDGCTGQDQCNQFQGFVVYRTQWQLPRSSTCRRCKLQWLYFTAHNCWPPCAATNKDEVTCENAQDFPTCGQPGAQYPEYFWNCADVVVLPGNDTAGGLQAGPIISTEPAEATEVEVVAASSELPTEDQQHLLDIGEQIQAETIDPQAAAGAAATAVPLDYDHQDELARRRRDLPPWEHKATVSTARFGSPSVVKLSGNGWRVMELAPKPKLGRRQRARRMQVPLAGSN